MFRFCEVFVTLCRPLLNYQDMNNMLYGVFLNSGWGLFGGVTAWGLRGLRVLGLAGAGAAA